MSLDDRRTGSAPYGYVNTFGGVPNWAFGRLYYAPPSEAAKSTIVSPASIFKPQTPCWPVCPLPRACAMRRACDAAERRAFAVALARFALGARA